MTQPTNPIITKIHHILRLAADQEGTPEGETAARLASRMMAAHAISVAEIDLTGQSDPDPLEAQPVRMAQSVWRRQLASTIAEHCSCEISWLTRRGRGLTVTYYGHRTDIEVARYLFEICERQIEREARAYIRKMGKVRWNVANPWQSANRAGDLRSLGNEFRRSAVAGLWQKLYTIRQEVASEAPTGTALVLARGQKVREWFADLSSGFRSCSTPACAANDAGYEAGQNISLSAGVGSTGKATARLSGK